MTLTHRTYTGLDDLKKIQDLLRAGRRVLPHSGYVHPGDIEWWLFYNPHGEPPEEFIHLWEDERGELAVCVVLTKRLRAAALFLHPAYRTAEMADRLVQWSEAVLRGMESEKNMLNFEEVYADDAVLLAALEKHGCEREPYLMYFARDLTQLIPEIVLPDGFHFLDKMQPEFAGQRAAVHFSAFSPHSKMTEACYRGFMNAPLYNPELDTVVIAPDGRFAAYAMGWAELKISVFEPVGTHEDFRRRGLGTAVLREGMRRLKARGMETATVCCAADNPGNIAFYQAAGFTLCNEILNFKKAAPEEEQE